MKRLWGNGSGGSSFSSTERSVARRVIGLGACGTYDSALEVADAGEGFAKEFAGRSRRNGRVLVCVTGELRTASRTGSKAGIALRAEWR